MIGRDKHGVAHSLVKISYADEHYVVVAVCSTFAISGNTTHLLYLTAETHLTWVTCLRCCTTRTAQ